MAAAIIIGVIIGLILAILFPDKKKKQNDRP